MRDSTSRFDDLDIDRRTVLRGAAASGIGLAGLVGSSGGVGARTPPGPPCFKDFECDDEEAIYVKIEFVIERDEEGNIVDCYFEEETDTGLVEITYWESKEGDECDPIYVEWEADGYVATKVTAFGGNDCDTVVEPDGSYSADREGEAGLDNQGGNTAAISNLQFCLVEEVEETEVIFVTDVSESMESNFPGTPDVDGDAGDSAAGGTALEAVKAHMGDHPGLGSDVNLLSEIASCGGSSIEVGSVSCADRLNHADDLGDGDGDDGPGGSEGFDAEGPAALDKALGSPTDADYGELKSLFGPGADFSPDFGIDDPDFPDYQAERPYVEDGGSTVPDGVLRAFQGLLPDGFVAASDDFDDVTGIDPSGNADTPGTVRKLMVVLTDGRPGEADAGFAQNVSDAAEDADIEIVPVIVNDGPGQNDIDFANVIATAGIDPLLAADYAELATAMEALVTEICPA